MLGTDHLSTLIGRIYDCAIDPGRWPATMEAICGGCGMHQATLMTVDLDSERIRFLAAWNVEHRYQQMITNGFQAMATDLYRQSLAADGDIDLPRTLSRHPMGYEAFRLTPMFTDWAMPQGVGDAANLLVLREPKRLGVFALTKLEARGTVTDDDMTMLRLLAPHLRRAVTISSIMDLKAVEAMALAATLDALAVGIVLVARDGRIVLANRRAGSMLEAGDVICSVRGRLAAARRRSNAELERAISLAAAEEAMGAAGICISLSRAACMPAVAHVLPLLRRDYRRALPPGAAAAVFITGAPVRSPAALGAVAESLGLTTAEGRLLAALMQGESISEAARSLAISRTTAKTHLAHIFEKTGVRRQSDLIRLAASLVPPVGPPEPA
jgi:DNA-binding CsgD family transcriptional regulator/PAS domain-containing protein